jgi:hypothetical protein
VLLHVQLDADERERIHCLACDAEIDPLEVRWVEEAALGELGYAVADAVGISGCGRPGCGGGRCGRTVEPEPVG